MQGLSADEVEELLRSAEPFRSFPDATAEVLARLRAEDDGAPGE